MKGSSICLLLINRTITTRSITLLIFQTLKILIMKTRISLMMLLSALFLWSCQKEELKISPTSQTDGVEQLAKQRGNQPVIFVHWGEDFGDPVVGARVFDMRSNELIAETNEEGNAYIDPIPGEYRVVDPNYGDQQAIVNYPEDFEYDEATGEEREIIGWTMDGKPVYADE